MNIKYLQKYFFFLIIATTSCTNQDAFKRPDVSKINLEVKIERFDEQLNSINQGEVAKYNKIWQENYPYFYPDYTINMLEIGSPEDSIRSVDNLKTVLQNKDYNALSKAVARTFPNLDKQEKELTQAFKYIKYYFPDYQLPKLIAFIGGFSFQTPVGEDYVGIGLDMFLGADSEFYPALVQNIPLYISRRFTPENISPRVVETILREDLIVEPTTANNTLQYMIHNGKILYAMDMLLEGAKDEAKIGYSQEQLAWAKRYQKDIWAWFIEENLLYNSDYPRIQKYFSEAPFTPELGENNESSPKLGTYIGWMIVRKYMERNPEVTLTMLLENMDAQQILEDSKFKG